jgi:hypothetical protein
MSAPSFVQAGAGWVSTGASASGSITGVTVGNFIILQTFEDGAGNNISLSAVTGVENLQGSDNFLEQMGPWGNSSNGWMNLWMGRALATTVSCTINTPGADGYARFYEIASVTAGSYAVDILENSTAGTFVKGEGTVLTISDVAVTTLGADRLALNFVAVDDDNALDPFAGETGGDWTEAVAEYATATGTDAALGLQIATIASAGTIDGGTDAMAVADNWLVVGFALIGTTPSTPKSLLLPRRIPQHPILRRF